MNQLFSVVTKNEQETMAVGSALAKTVGKGVVFTLEGDLGAGKTVFTKGIGKYLGIKRTINSPTFTIMKIYDTNNSIINKLYHLDVYRLDNSESDFELEEYFYLDGLTVIEWSVIIEDILPIDMWNIEINIISENERIVKIIHNSEELTNKLVEENYEIIHR